MLPQMGPLSFPNRAPLPFPNPQLWFCSLLASSEFSSLNGGPKKNKAADIRLERGQILARNLLSRRDLLTTETELMAMAAEAIMGLRRRPQNGYRTPAAIGIPRTL